MTSIEWTDETWNPTVGCEIVSPGCTNCYAMRMAARCEAMGVAHYAGTTLKAKAGAVWTGQINVAPEHILLKPFSWRQPRRVFVNSMSDLFAAGVPIEVIDRVFAVMALNERHTFQVLTKRPARARAYLTDPKRIVRMLHLDVPHPTGKTALADLIDFVVWEKPLPNVWLGTSAERQREAAERLPQLLATPAAVRFVSLEPALETTYLRRLRLRPREDDRWLDALTGRTWYGRHEEDAWKDTQPLDWVIWGGESGPAARAVHPDAARQVRDDCAAAGVPFFYKQRGAHAWAERVEGDPSTLAAYRVGKHSTGYDLLDGIAHKAFPQPKVATHG